MSEPAFGILGLWGTMRRHVRSSGDPLLPAHVSTFHKVTQARESRYSKLLDAHSDLRF